MSEGIPQKIIHVYVDEHVHRRLKVTAASRGVSIAAVVRAAVAERVDEMEREQTPRPRGRDRRTRRQPVDPRSIEP